jgi:hypothetical protein
METQNKPKRTSEQMLLFPMFELKRHPQDITGKNQLLYKNGEICGCPHQSNLKNNGTVVPCGTWCALFGLAMEMDEQKKPTGKVHGVLACGSGKRVLLSNWNLSEKKEGEDDKHDNIESEQPKLQKV